MDSRHNQRYESRPHDRRQRRSGCWALILCLLLVRQVTGGASPTNVVDRPATELADLSLAQLMDLQVPTVVTASKHEQKASEAPAAVTVITKDDIKKYGYRTLADILRSVRGFYITYDRSYGFIGVRGLNRPGDYGGRVLILLDGHRLNDPIYDTAAVMNDFLLDVDLIERVEIIRGPGSSLYGNNAFFAVVNILTRRGQDVAGTELSGSAGEFDSYKARISSGKKLDNGVDLLVSGSWFDSGGNPRLAFHFDDPTPHTSIARGLDDENAYNLFGKLSYRDVSFEAGYASRDKQAPTGLYGTDFGDPRFVTTDMRGFAEAKYTHGFGERGEVMARAYYDYYAYQAGYPFSGVLNRDDQDVQFLGTELQWRQTLWEKHRLTLGGEARDVFELRLHNFDVAPPANYQNISRSTQDYALYGQDEFQVLDNLILNAGLRFDYFDDFGNTLNPRVALIHNPRAGTTLKFIYGTAFRAPNAYEHDYYSIQNAGLSALQPEKITTYELIGEQAIGQQLRATVAGFYNKIDALISQNTTTNGTVFFDNVDSVETLGAEAELQGQWHNGVRGRVSYAFVETRDVASERHLNNSPRHLAKLNLIVPVVADKLFAGVELQYTSPRTTLGGTTLDEYWIANVTLFSQKLVNGWELSASVYNLFDQRFSDPSSDVPDIISQDGRTWRVKLTYRF